ncbi:hypothetical protein, partial [Mesorhizobium sp. M7A.F.Ca.US.001.02.1.1]|uniref:hypothetical protein n=1 Tax=Mesorhizobium sp. M7A.F.Ca.US.001.02.1.1 TaxID=2496703 RepID=UPI0019D4B2D5
LCSSSKDEISTRNSKASVAFEFLTNIRARISNPTQKKRRPEIARAALNSGVQIIEDFSDH